MLRDSEGDRRMVRNAEGSTAAVTQCFALDGEGFFSWPASGGEQIDYGERLAVTHRRFDPVDGR